MITATPVVGDVAGNAYLTNAARIWDVIAPDDAAGSVTIPIDSLFPTDGNKPLIPSLTPLSYSGALSGWYVEELAANDSITLSKQGVAGSGSEQVQLRLTLIAPPEYWATA